MRKPRARFIGKAGYDCQVKDARKFLTVGKVYTITDCSVDRYSSTVEVQGRRYNSVLFGITTDRLLKYFPHRNDAVTKYARPDPIPEAPYARGSDKWVESYDD